MSPFIKKLMKETGKDESEIKELWKKSKDITSDTFGLDESEFSNREYMYAKETVKSMLGYEDVITVADFIESDKSAKDFISSKKSSTYNTETVTSGDFSSLDKSVTKKKKDDEEEDEKEIEEARKDGTPPDGTGPHGRGNGPGKGKADGSGMKNADTEDDSEEDEEEDEKEKEEKSCDKKKK